MKRPRHFSILEPSDCYEIHSQEKLEVKFPHLISQRERPKIEKSSYVNRRLICTREIFDSPSVFWRYGFVNKFWLQ